ncbi:MAG: hypothetical protein DRI61_03420 [Chloroflexi bacterium]|nr:MAG: hypothetical protein DRI61_03420 [Chloroflexota bacterium]HDN79904.1 DUF3307 domain-containing protein [Chloroflexota bacterium]
MFTEIPAGSVMELLIRLLLAHMLGDFAFQSSGLVIMKKESWKGLAIHTLIVTVCTAALSWGYSPLWWAITLVVSGSHMALDAFRSSIPRAEPSREFLYFLGDQFLHLGLILATVLAFERSLPRWDFASSAEIPLHLKVMICFIAFIFLLWEVPLVERYVLDLLPSCYVPRANFQIEPLQRLLGGIERTLFVLLFIMASPLAVILAFIPRAFTFTGGRWRCNLYRIGVSLALTLPVTLLLMAISRE